jgi:hypothetical protein
MSDLAYCARYGKQPLSELRAMTFRELQEFKAALCDIVRRENAAGDEEDEG